MNYPRLTTFIFSIFLICLATFLYTCEAKETKNKEQKWLAQKVIDALKSVRVTPAKKVELTLTGFCLDEKITVEVNQLFCERMLDHASSNLRISSIHKTFIVIDYESRFDATSFGDGVTIDKGSVKVELPK